MADQDQDIFNSPAPAAAQTPAQEQTPDDLIRAANDRFKDAVGVDYVVNGKGAVDAANADKYNDAEKQAFAEQIDLSARAFEARLALEAETTGRTVEEIKKDAEVMNSLRKEFGEKLGEVINSKEDKNLEVGAEFERENAQLKTYAEELEKQAAEAKAANEQKNRDTNAPDLSGAGIAPGLGRDTNAPSIEEEEKSKDVYLTTETHMVNRVNGAVQVYDIKDGLHPVINLSAEDTKTIIADLAAIRADREGTSDLQKETLGKLGLGGDEKGLAAFAALAETSASLRETFGIPDPADKEAFQVRINELQAMVKPEVAPAQTIDPLAPAAGVGIAVVTPDEGVAPSPKPRAQAPEGIAVVTPDEGVAPSPKPRAQAPEGIAVVTPDEGVAPSPKPKAPEGIAVATPDEGVAPSPKPRAQAPEAVVEATPAAPDAKKPQAEVDGVGKALQIGSVVIPGLSGAVMGIVNSIRSGAQAQGGFGVATASDGDLGNVNAGISKDAPQKPLGTAEEAGKDAQKAGVNSTAAAVDRTQPVQANIAMDTKSFDRLKAQTGGVA